jgi:hypothetical protein
LVTNAQINCQNIVDTPLGSTLIASPKKYQFILINWYF